MKKTALIKVTMEQKWKHMKNHKPSLIHLQDYATIKLRTLSFHPPSHVLYLQGIKILLLLTEDSFLVQLQSNFKYPCIVLTTSYKTISSWPVLVHLLLLNSLRLFEKHNVTNGYVILKDILNFRFWNSTTRTQIQFLFIPPPLILSQKYLGDPEKQPAIFFSSLSATASLAAQKSL